MPYVTREILGKLTMECAQDADYLSQCLDLLRLFIYIYIRPRPYDIRIQISVGE